MYLSYNPQISPNISPFLHICPIFIRLNHHPLPHVDLGQPGEGLQVLPGHLLGGDAPSDSHLHGATAPDPGAPGACGAPRVDRWSLGSIGGGTGGGWVKVQRPGGPQMGLCLVQFLRYPILTHSLRCLKDDSRAWKIEFATPLDSSRAFWVLMSYFPWKISHWPGWSWPMFSHIFRYLQGKAFEYGGFPDPKTALHLLRTPGSPQYEYG